MKVPRRPGKLTEATIAGLLPDVRRYDVPDHVVNNLCVTVYPSGRKSWAFRYRADGKSKRFLIGDASLISPIKARRKAKSLAGDIANGVDPNRAKFASRLQAVRSREGTLRSFIDSRYESWAAVERLTGKETVKRIQSAFSHLLDKSMDQITVWEIEKWRRDKHKAGKSTSTTNRDITALRGCLSKALEWGVIDAHPLKGLKASKLDKSAPIRLIGQEEENALRKALRQRDAEIRKKRASANKWRTNRARNPYPDFGDYVDHVEPIILLALNTGMRRGEILKLRWADVDSDQLIVQGETTKNKQSRIIPLNMEAKNVFRSWSSNGEYIFSGMGHAPITTIKRSWATIRKSANLPALRFHDLRHTFATRLLQKGVDIQTVSNLLGHRDIATTGHYLHATDETKRKAVELL
jgi:integrase